ncbi:MAG: hypothetical protein K1X94_34920, partial [Sandaracinaceae bacterium]|nr:hypothetical protein [Sandaracinaceae bacterium]
MVAVTLTAACDGTSGGPDGGTDGGFGDAALVVEPPTRIVDESRDLGLLLTMRALPNDDPTHVPSVIEISAYDTSTGALAWSDREEMRAPFVFAASRPDPHTGYVGIQRNVEIFVSRPPVRIDYDPRGQVLVDASRTSVDAYPDPLDFGEFIVQPHEQAGQAAMRVFGRERVEPFTFDPGPVVADIGPRTMVWRYTRGPGGTLMLDARRYSAPEAQNFPADGGVETLFVEQRIEGVFDVFLVEPSTGNLLGVGERRPPDVERLTDGRLDANLIDRRGA